VIFHILIFTAGIKTLRRLDTVLKRTADYDNSNHGFDVTSPPFVSATTNLGLRITINSFIEMINYLLNDLKFKYVLTGKMNQDCLEVWNLKYDSLYFIEDYYFTLEINIAIFRNHPNSWRWKRETNSILLYSTLQHAFFILSYENDAEFSKRIKRRLR